MACVNNDSSEHSVSFENGFSESKLNIQKEAEARIFSQLILLNEHKKNIHSFRFDKYESIHEMVDDILAPRPILSNYNENNVSPEDSVIYILIYQKGSKATSNISKDEVNNIVDRTKNFELRNSSIATFKLEIIMADPIQNSSFRNIEISDAVTLPANISLGQFSEENYRALETLISHPFVALTIDGLDTDLVVFSSHAEYVTVANCLTSAPMAQILA